MGKSKSEPFLHLIFFFFAISSLDIQERATFTITFYIRAVCEFGSSFALSYVNKWSVQTERMTALRNAENVMCVCVCVLFTYYIIGAS